MKIEFLQDSDQKEPKVLVVAREQNREVQALIEELERMFGETVQAYDQENVCILMQADLLRVYAEGARVLCQTADGIYTLRARLYEMEACLDPQSFVRISKCEIVNVRKILRLDVSLTGTVGIVLEGEIKTYTSRRYVQKLKSFLGLGKEGRT